jgi:elongation factor Ts
MTQGDFMISRKMRNGIIDAYIHHNKVGVLVEINCDSDFAARCEEFKTLVRNIAMQIAACPYVEYVTIEDIPPEVFAKIKEIENNRDDLTDEPDEIKQKIVRGRIQQHLQQICLMEQPYIRDQNITVEALIKQTAETLNENITIRRFTRYMLESEEND